MKMRSIIIGMVLAVGLLVPVAVAAHPTTQTDGNTQTVEDRKTQLEIRRQQVEERLSQIQARRCEFVKTRLEFHRDRSAVIREHRKARYLRIIDRLNALADRLDAHELDSTALRAAITELSDLVETYADTYTDYEAALQDALNVVCEDDEVSKAAVKEARDLLVKLHANAESIHTFFQDELKPLLADIRELVQTERQTETDQTN